MAADPFSQSGYRVRLEWGRRGARDAALRGDAVVIVDVLCFSTTVVTAVHHGATVRACPPDEDLKEFARTAGAEIAVRRQDVPERGRFSLSPLSFVGAARGRRVLLPSPNGAACIRAADGAPAVLVGALVNAEAVSGAVVRLLGRAEGLCVTVVACGERWDTPSEDGELRFGVEDYLGAGAILARLPFPRSPEAEVCAGAFTATQERLTQTLWECASGRELRDRGYGGDVEFAARLDAFAVVPVLRDGWLDAL